MLWLWNKKDKFKIKPWECARCSSVPRYVMGALDYFPSDEDPSICNVCVWYLAKAAEKRHKKCIGLAALVAGGLAHGDAYRGTIPTADEIAKRAWEIADAIIRNQPDVTWDWHPPEED